MPTVLCKHAFITALEQSCLTQMMLDKTVVLRGMATLLLRLLRYMQPANSRCKQVHTAGVGQQEAKKDKVCS